MDIGLGEIWNSESITANEDIPLLKSEGQIEFELQQLKENQEPVFKQLKKWEIQSFSGSSPCKTEFQIALDALQDEKLIANSSIQEPVILIKKNAAFEAFPSSAVISSNSELKGELSEYLATIDCTNLLKESNISIAEYFNIQVDSLETKALLNRKISNLSRTEGVIKEGELVVKSGELVTEEVFSRIQSYYKLNDGETQSFWKVNKQYGFLIIASILFVCLLLFIQKFYPNIYQNRGRSTFIVSVIIVFGLLTKLTLSFEITNALVVPFILIPIVIKPFFKGKFALVLHLLSVIYSACLISQPFEMLLTHGLVGMVITMIDFSIIVWSQFFISILMLLGLYVLSFSGYRMLFSTLNLEIFIQNLGRIGFNGFVTLSAYPLIPLVGKILGIISELTLVELSNPEKPLLKKLRAKAPGTFQHSLSVGTLAEAACQRLGGNALLVKVGAMYHDIGKMERPSFFIENQSGNNPHDQLEPKKSAEIIINHVLNGMDMAKKANLPKVIQRFISTHHGTTKVDYFLSKEKELSNDPDQVNDENFTYPGPKPKTLEESIMMLADSVEAAAKALPEKSPEAFDKLIAGIIESKIQKNQLDNSPLTFNDLSIIKFEFNKVLKSMYHVRVQYPKEEEAAKT